MPGLFVNGAPSWRRADRRVRSSLLAGLLTTVFCLAGCSLTGPKAVPGNGDDVGMHIDARLEFAVEYPLRWGKERLVYPEEDRGLVRWRASGDGEVEVELTISSVPSAIDVVERQRVLQQLPGFQMTLREQVTIASLAAEHLIGHTARANYHLWFLSAPRRTFLVQFKAPPELFDSYTDVLAEILRSFQIVDPDAATPRSY